jgi:hypothetical protein
MAWAKPMVSMELTDEEKLDTVCPVPMPSKPDYPYGLKITLTHAELEKLGCDIDDACIDGIFHLHGLARITALNKDKDAYGKETCRVEAQIESLSIEDEDDENEE